MDVEKQIEYIAISVSSGAVFSITPSSPQTLSALAPGAHAEIGTVVNKMAEYGYRLIDGSISTGEVSPGGGNYIIFMEREK